MSTNPLICNLEYKISNPIYIKEINGGLSISYIIKTEIYKKTDKEIFTKFYRYDYKVIDNKITDVEYFIIDDTTWIGEMNDTDWGCY